MRKALLIRLSRGHSTHERDKEHSLTAFRALLISLWLILAGYTAIVISNQGTGFFKVFFGDLMAMGWPGQFNLDFLFLLLLATLWVAWRHRFSGAGLLLGALVLCGGNLFLMAYLVVVTGQARGDVKEVLLGEGRAAQIGPG
jgi:hypothetical protein